MRLSHKLFIAAVLAIASVLSASCIKEHIQENQLPTKDGIISLRISGQLDEFSSDDQTRSSLVSVVRVRWEDGDEVYVYDGSSCLGSLEATVSDAKGRVAILSGDIKAPEGDKLALIHSNLFENEPAVTDGKITIDLSDQSLDSDYLPFAVYSVLDFSSVNISNLVADFSFATSALSAAVSGLEPGEAISYATLSGVNTKCVLTLEAGKVTASGSDPGAVKRTAGLGNANSRGTAIIKLALPVSPAASKTLSVTQGSSQFCEENFSSNAVAAGRSISVVNPVGSSDIFCINALGQNVSISLKKSTGDVVNALEYSTDLAYWAEVVWDGNKAQFPVLANIGDKLYIRAKESRTSVPSLRFTSSGGNFEVSGNIMYLVDPTGQASSLNPNEFYMLFRDDSNLVDASDLILPAMTLAKSCYAAMFYYCTSLTAAPELPATVMAESCYQSMFGNCSSLTAAPELPAKTLAKSCYNTMFASCSSLTTAPVLPASALSDGCYNSMFRGCTSLTSAPELPALTLVPSCYEEMFNYCTSLTVAPVLRAEVLAEDCYSGMFCRCSSLTSVTCLATDITASRCTSSWLEDVPSSGVFKTYPDTKWSLDSSSGIPSGWTAEYIENEGVQLWAYGPRWARMNVGAKDPQDSGDYYAWGETSTYYTSLRPDIAWKEGKEDGYSWGSYFDTPDRGYTYNRYYYGEGGKVTLEPDDDVAHVKWGGSWHIPSAAEWTALLNNTEQYWVTDYDGSGVNGYLFTGKGGYSDKSIFLPAAGNFFNNQSPSENCGYYWVSSLSDLDSDVAKILVAGQSLNQYEVLLSCMGRRYGLTVRPVSD